MIRILFICHGNICRSPMAEFIFKKMIKESGLEDQFYVESKATSSEEIWHGKGNPVYPAAKRELLKHNILCEGKTAVQLTKDDYNKFDYLIGMDAMNIRNIHRITGHKDKTYLLLSFTGDQSDVEDPWYSGDFTKAYDDIERGCNALLNKLRRNI